MLDLDKISKEADKLIDESFKNMTPEQMEEYFPEDKTPKGWVSIEDALPMMLAMDVMRGGSMYRVKDKDGNEFESGVSDHNTWYYIAKEQGFTHWWNPERMDVIILADGITAREANKCKLPECRMEELDANAHPEFAERLKMEWDNYHKAEDKLRTFEIKNRAYYGRHIETGENMYGGFKADTKHYAEVLPNGKIIIKE